MSARQFPTAGAALAALCIGVYAFTARGEVVGKEEVDRALRKQLDVIEQKWQAGDARGIVDAVYTEQTSITGEGSPELYAGKAQLNALLSELLKEPAATRIVLNQTRVLNATAAYSWVTWDVRPANPAAKPFQMKSLFVWEKTASGWKIVADMYASGAITKAP